MRHLSLLIGTRFRTVRFSGRAFLASSRLRVVVVTGLIALFWLLMLAIFWETFAFLHKHFEPISGLIVDYLFSFLFLSLLVMMTVSDAIIAYTSLYRSEETNYLFSLPVGAADIFAYRSGDSAVFSLWAIGTMVVPMVLAYGLVFPAAWHFYVFALALSLLFVLLATEIGAFLAVLVGFLLPRRRRSVLAALCGVGLGLSAAWFLPLWHRLEDEALSEGAVRAIMDRIAFCQHWALPSRWVSRGMLAAANGNAGEALFLLCLLLSNALFLGVVAHRLAFYVYRRSWGSSRDLGRGRRGRLSNLLARPFQGAVLFLPSRLRQLMLKDFKTFLRDPSQWSQFLLFFGLLGLYILNLPRFRVMQMGPYWHSLVSLLNLAATCLTLATLTTRFVFPQMSLEGRRIWLLGLLPVRREAVLWAKWTFATLGTFAVSGGLIALSDAVLDLPGWVRATHMWVSFCVCCGLNGLAIGLGARYPRLRTDNPAKIVSSFGGTLSLICSICFIALVVGSVAVPLHLHVISTLPARATALGLAGGLLFATGVSAAALFIPMLAGARAFARMEF